MENDNKNRKITFDDLIDSLVREEIVFLYDRYNIVGDTAEIDKVINTCGIINIEVGDVYSILSEDTVNYVSVGYGEGTDNMADVLKNAVSLLPIDVNEVSGMIFNVWIPEDMKASSIRGQDLLSDYVSGLPKDINFIWGIARDESLASPQIKVTLIAASR